MELQKGTLPVSFWHVCCNRKYEAFLHAGEPAWVRML